MKGIIVRFAFVYSLISWVGEGKRLSLPFLFSHCKSPVYFGVWPFFVNILFSLHIKRKKKLSVPAEFLSCILYNMQHQSVCGVPHPDYSKITTINTNVKMIGQQRA